MAVKIAIDAGHGGFDSGASYQGRREKDDVLRLAMAVGEILERAGYDVVYTRTNDVYNSPFEKATIGNNAGVDYFVSIHRNSSETPNQYSGVETLVYDDSGIKSIMARNVNEELEKVGFRNIGVTERPGLAVLRRTNMPAILVEAGFINNEADNRLFDENFDQIANAIATGIENTINNSENSNSITDNNIMQNNNEDNSIYRVQVGLYRVYANAENMLDALIEDDINGIIDYEQPYYAVLAGSENTLDDAVNLERRLRNLGYDTLVVKM